MYFSEQLVGDKDSLEKKLQKVNKSQLNKEHRKAQDNKKKTFFSMVQQLWCFVPYKYLFKKSKFKKKDFEKLISRKK